MEGAERFPISDNETLYEYRKSRLSKHLRSARYRLTKNSEFSLYSYLHTSFVPIMAETDDNSALLLRQDGLIYGPARVQMRQKIRHGESRKNATIGTSNPTSFKPSRGNPKTESSVCITRPNVAEGARSSSRRKVRRTDERMTSSRGYEILSTLGGLDE